MTTGAEDTGAAQPCIYQLDPTRFAGLRRSMILRMAILGALIVAGVWYMDGRVVVFDFVGVPAILASVVYNSLRRERKNWNTLVLEFSAERLIRRLPDFPPLEIAPTEVTKIVESTRGVTNQDQPPTQASVC
jgi:hypothetical protein